MLIDQAPDRSVVPGYANIDAPWVTYALTSAVVGVTARPAPGRWIRTARGTAAWQTALAAATPGVRGDLAAVVREHRLDGRARS